MKSNLNRVSFQELNLEVGERASNNNTYPKESLVVVECIKDFADAPNDNYIINNSSEFVKVVEFGMIGLSTSHLISSDWVAEDVRFNK